MLDKKKRIASFIIAFTLACGFTVLIILVGVGFTILREMIVRRHATTAALTKKGDVMLIHTSYGNGRYSQDYRDLDGKAVSQKQMYSDATYHFFTGHLLLGNSGPRHWSQRIAGFRSGKADWYLIRSALADDVYFVGYEEQGIVGYLGANGYQTSQPTRDERIRVSPNAKHGFLAGKNGSGALLPLGMVNQNSSRILVVATQGVLEVDFVESEVSMFADIKDASQLAVSSTQDGFAIRDEKHVHLLDFEGNLLSKVDISAVKEGYSLTVYPELDDRIAVATASLRNTGATSQDIYWYKKDAAGETKTKLVEQESFDELSSSPIGIVEYMAMAVSSPLTSFFMPTLSVILATCIVPVLLAFVTWRNEVGTTRKTSWALFTFVLGLSGFLGYWFHRKRKETLISCLKCRELIPKLNYQCESCRESLPLPPRLGTEIFA